MFLVNSKLKVDLICTTDPIFLEWLVDVYKGEIVEDPVESAVDIIPIVDRISDPAIMTLKTVLFRDQADCPFELASNSNKVVVFNYPFPFIEDDPNYTVKTIKDAGAKIVSYMVIKTQSQCEPPLEFAPISEAENPISHNLLYP